MHLASSDREIHGPGYVSIDITDPGKSCYSEGKIKPFNVVSVSKWLEQQLATNIVVNINSTFLGMKFAEVPHCP